MFLFFAITSQISGKVDFVLFLFVYLQQLMRLWYKAHAHQVFIELTLALIGEERRKELSSSFKNKERVMNKNQQAIILCVCRWENKRDPKIMG